MAENPEEGQRPAGDGDIPPVEWTLAAIGLALLLGVVGFLGYQSFFVDGTPPAVTISVAQKHAVPGGHLVRLRAWNGGGSTAAEVKVEATLSRPGTAPETREVTFDYVPPRSERFAGVLFREEPPEHALDLRVISYREP